MIRAASARLKLHLSLALHLGAAILWLLGKTWRFRLVDKAGILQRPVSGQDAVVWVFWHNRLIIIPTLWRRSFQHRRGGVLISRSKDGELLAKIVSIFGGEPVRGSSSRGGASALANMRRKMAEARDAYITPDGPRGPKYSVSPGAVWLAQTTGAPIMPVSMEPSRYWRLKSWDGFMIPKPFAKIEVTFQPLHYVPRSDEDAAVPAECEKLRELLLLYTGIQ